ncbi:hypothetical protein ABZ756_06435 [Mammaliicoccus sciuri]
MLNEGALQAVGVAVRQTGGLPDWLIAEAIRQRRSEFKDVALPLNKCSSLILFSQTTPYLLVHVNEGALQAVGVAMRQTGGLPDWLIAGAIRQRRSVFDEITLFLVLSRI